MGGPTKEAEDPKTIGDIQVRNGLNNYNRLIRLESIPWMTHFELNLIMYILLMYDLY